MARLVNWLIDWIEEHWYTQAIVVMLRSILAFTIVTICITLLVIYIYIQLSMC